MKWGLGLMDFGEIESSLNDYKFKLKFEVVNKSFLLISVGLYSRRYFQAER